MKRLLPVLISLVIAVFAISACANSPYRFSEMSTAELRQVSGDYLWRLYNFINPFWSGDLIPKFRAEVI